MTREQKLERMLDKFILISLQSEINIQSLLSHKLMMSEVVHSAKSILTIPINVVYKETINSFQDLEILNMEDDNELVNLTSEAEYLDILSDLVSDIKEDLIE